MIHHGDCLDVMRTMAPDSVDAVVSDPPYGLSFMGKQWDHGVPGIPFWQEAFRVAKPGAHLVAFGGTRTYHRLACAIEDAGWEIRDCLSWLYGSGFPKSHNGPWGGTALKPAWEPIILARKPLIGTVAANVTAHGTGGLNIDGCRIATSGEDMGDPARWDKAFLQKHEGWMRPSHTTNASDYANRRGAAIEKAATLGRWPANVVLDEAAGKLVDAQSGERTSGVPGVRRKNHDTTAMSGRLGLTGEQETGYGDTGGASRFFYCAKASRSEREAGLEGMPTQEVLIGAAGHKINPTTGREVVDVPRVNGHPTVKPLSLMRWLCRLVTPQGGLILDPFCGSGSTGCAAVQEGFEFVGIEKELEYVAIAEKRIAYWSRAATEASEQGTLLWGTSP